MRDFDPTASEFISSGYIDMSRPGGLLYDFMSIASVAAPIIGGMMGSDASGDASNAQIAASDRASATQEAARRQQRQDLMPWMQGGQAANNALLSRLGIGSANTGAFTPKTADQLRQELIGQYTTSSGGTDAAMEQYIRDRVNSDSRPAAGSPVEQYIKSRMPAGDWSLAGGLYDQYMQSRPYAGQQQGNSAVDEAGLQAAIQQAMANQGPATAGGVDPNYGTLLKKFDQSDLNSDLVYQNGLQFGLNTGINQLNQRAAAGGNYGSGAALKALTRFGNDYATTKTEGAYNRNQGEKAQTYNFLSGVSGQGQSAAAGVGAAGLATGNNIANNQLAAGNASAAGIVGGANAMSNGLAGATNAYQWNQLMSRPKTNTALSNSWDIPMQPGGGY